MKQRIKILHLSASDSGGAYVFAENLIANTNADKFEVRHLVFTGKNQNFRFIGIPFLDSLIKNGLHAFEKCIQYFYEKDKHVRFKFSLGFPGIPLFMLKRICKDYDILHLHWINKGFIRIKDLKALGKPIVWTCHDLWPVSGGCHLSMGCDHFKQSCGNCHFLKSPSGDDFSAALFKVKQNLYPHLHLSFVSPSNWMHTNIAESALGKGKAGITIHNGVDTEIFRYREKTEKSDKYTLGFVAANLNDLNKALYRVAEALQLLTNKSGFKLLLIGNKKAEFDFEIPVSYEIVSDCNSKEEMSLQYARMDCLLCTSGIETFPTTLMEAYCCGVQGLGFKVGGIPEIIERMGGKCLTPFSIPELSAAIEELKLLPKNPEQTAVKAASVFGIRQTASAYETVYTDCLSRS